MKTQFNLLTLILLFLLMTGNVIADNKAKSIERGERELSARMQAKVIDIDYKAREITLQTAGGEKQTLIAGSELRNFNKIKRGDTVLADYTATFSFVVNKGRNPASVTGETTSATSTAGSTPAGVATKTRKISVIVTAIDKKVPSITVKNTNGEASTFLVSHPEKLKEVSVGDQIDITFTEALALSVTK